MTRQEDKGVRGRNCERDDFLRKRGHKGCKDFGEGGQRGSQNFFVRNK